MQTKEVKIIISITALNLPGSYIMITTFERIAKYLQSEVNLNDQEKLCNKYPFAFLNTVTEKILPPLKV